MTHLAHSPPAALSLLLPGSWALISRVDVTESGERSIDSSLGEDPTALLFYDRAGNFGAQFMKRDRSASPDISPAALNNSRAQNGYDAYFGTYTVDDVQATVTQRLIGALSPENVGLVLTRKMVVQDDLLKIDVNTQTSHGENVTRILRWKRVG